MTDTYDIEDYGEFQLVRPGREDGEDVRVLQLGRQLDFLLEAGGADLAGHVGWQQLDDHPPVERPLGGQKQQAHPPRLELALQLKGVA